MPISVEKAIELILKETPVLQEESVPLLDALGRTTSRDLCAVIRQPPFDRSPLDGYAVTAADLEGADRDHPVVLQVIDEVYAGAVARTGIQRGQAVRLMTGSMIPEGADCVIRQEDTDQGEQIVQIYKFLKADSNICHKGEEYEIGDCLLPKGTVVDAAAVAVAAGAGMTHLPVYRRMRVAILSTGDEVCQPGQALTPGKIYDSNSSYLTARLHQMGAQVVTTLSVQDDMEQIVSALDECEPQVDLLITTGGVSVGQKDLIEAAVEKFGGSIIFHGIAMKPGMPTLFAKKNDTLVLGLSGNPFAAAVPFELFLRPMLSHMTCTPTLEPQRDLAHAGNDFPKRSETRRFIRASCRNGVVKMPSEQGNGQMRSMIGCNCLVDVPAGSGMIRSGDPLAILWL